MEQIKEIAPLRTIFPMFQTIECETNCPKHGLVRGFRYVREGVEEDYKNAPICPMCEKEQTEREEQEAREREERYQRQQFESLMRDRNIEPEYWGKELSDYTPQTEEQKKALEAVTDLINTKTGKVILLGSNGVGKTLLGSIAVKELGGKILSMYEITTMIRQSYSARAEKTELEITKELASLPMLVIDEMGRTKGSDAELNWLSYILDKRHTRRLPFMILSNTHLSRDCPKKGCDSCFERFVNNDVLSRLRQETKIITIKAPDYRGRK